MRGLARAGRSVQAKIEGHLVRRFVRARKPARENILCITLVDKPNHERATLDDVAVPDRFEVYGSYGERFANRGDWWAIVGVRLQSRKLL